MRIEFKIMPGPFRSYYEFGGLREQIRFDGWFYWNFDGKKYRTCASNYPKIYHNDERIASRSIKSVRKQGGSLWTSLMEWNVVDCHGQNWRLIQTQRNGGWFVDWKFTEGNRVMAFRQSCWNGTAVIRSDWFENVGLLVGLVIPLVLSSG